MRWAGVGVLLLVGCSRQTGTGTGAATASASATASATASASAMTRARPYAVFAPAGDALRPLVIVLHGYGGNGAGQYGYFGMSRWAGEAIVAVPDGTPDHKGMRFWNASDACCDFDGRGPDDVAYLEAIVDEVARAHAVDARRVYAVGHSNGGFMALRWACDRPRRLAAVVSLAGAALADAARCASEGTSVLQLHGDADELIRFGGGSSFGNGAPYPGARETVRAFAARAGCKDAIEPAGGALDLETTLAGAETKRERFACPPGPAFELWTVRGGAHTPSLGPGFADAVLAFLLAHPRS